MLLVAALTPIVVLGVSEKFAYLVFTVYLTYWVARSLVLAVRQAYEFTTMRRYRQTPWSLRLRQLTDPYSRLHRLQNTMGRTRAENEEMRALRNWVHTGPEVPPPHELYHLIVMPVANEDTTLVEQSLDALLDADYPTERLLVCVSVEARSRAWSADDLARLESRYGARFGMFLATRHPDDLPGEQRVKGANISWGAQLARQELHRRGITDEQVVVSAFDADTRPARHYFQVLSYAYLTNPNRDIDSYQPVLLFHNNVWDVPVVSRLVGYIAACGRWSTRPAPAGCGSSPRTRWA